MSLTTTPQQQTSQQTSQHGSKAVVATAIELERLRIKQAFAGVYRPDGTVDEEQLRRFARALHTAHQMREDVA